MWKRSAMIAAVCILAGVATANACYECQWDNTPYALCHWQWSASIGWGNCSTATDCHGQGEYGPCMLHCHTSMLCDIMGSRETDEAKALKRYAGLTVLPACEQSRLPLTRDVTAAWPL